MRVDYDIGKALSGLPAWNGRIVIDGTNPVEFLDPNSPDAKDPSNPLASYGIKAGLVAASLLRQRRNRCVMLRKLWRPPRQ